MSGRLMVYGSYGYTGRLVVGRAIGRGLKPVLAGRNAEALEAQAAGTKIERRRFSLDDPAAVREGLAGIAVVLHCAGPFARTALPMTEACLATGTHYVDVTGEISVFEGLAARDAAARAARVMLLPGAGFDVVPTDCLAGHVARRLPSATRLALAFRGTGGISRGTATTMVENLPGGGRVRRGGRIERVPLAWKTRRVDFGDGPEPVTTIPWGDVATAWHSTGIPDIEVYAAMPPAVRRLLVAARPLAPLLGAGPLQRLAKAWVRRRAPGPTEEERGRGSTRVWAEAADDAGRRAVSRLFGPEGYTFTAHAAVAAAERALDGDAPAGFRTPSTAFGPDFALGLEGVRREDVL